MRDVAELGTTCYRDLVTFREDGLLQTHQHDA